MTASQKAYLKMVKKIVNTLKAGKLAKSCVVTLNV